jgi:hypothetical protein
MYTGQNSYADYYYSDMIGIKWENFTRSWGEFVFKIKEKT